MKATSIFGGLQVFQIIIAIIRTKFVAVLLGPTGMGISGLLTSATELIAGFTNFGLGISAVKNVAAANISGDNKRVSVILKVLSRWVWVTGLLGMIVTIITAPWLSQITFGNRDYTIHFIWISISLLFSQLSSGNWVVLQGLRKLQLLAKANLIGSLLSLLLTVPLYYWFGLNGIVPSIIISASLTLFFAWFFRKKIKTQKVNVSPKRVIAEGKDMLSMGLMICLSGIVALGGSYIVRIFINHLGGVDQVGLFNAGFAIVNTYVGLVFSAMATDYYPRLSEVAQDNLESKKIINQQAEISILIIAPFIISFFVFINWIIILLYSSKFACINNMILWAAFGMIFKAVSWAIAFVIVAKGERRLFFWNELIGSSYILVLNLCGYYFWGLTGLGVSFLIGYVIYLFQVFFLAKFKYGFNLYNETVILFFVQFFLVLLAFLVIRFINGNWSYIIGIILLGLSVIYSIRELDKRIGIKNLIAKVINTKPKKS